MTSLVKICGLRDPGNILEVIKLKPDLIGLIFYPDSPRYVTDLNSLKFLNDLHGKPLTVGVFVDPTLQEIRTVANSLHLDVIQLHGSETPAFCEEVRKDDHAVIKAFGIRPGFDFCTTEQYRGVADFFLFDTGSDKPGGTGEQFDWDLLDFYHGETSYFLSGGLTPDTQIFPNHIQMAGVDLNSRFEKAPGIKDIGLLKPFIKQFRNE